MLEVLIFHWKTIFLSLTAPGLDFFVIWSYIWYPIQLVRFWFSLESQSNLLYSDLTLEGQSNLWLKFYHMSTYLDFPLTASLVALWLCYAYLLDRTHNLDAKKIGFRSNMHLLSLAYRWSPAWLGFENLWRLRSIWIAFFLPESLSKAFVGCKTLFHSVFLF